MSTVQNYAGRGNYATIMQQTKSAPTFRAEINQLVTLLASHSGHKIHNTFQWAYNKLHAFYGVDVHRLPRRKGETLLLTCERNDVLDRLFSVVLSELLSTGEEGRTNA